MRTINVLRFIWEKEVQSFFEYYFTLPTLAFPPIRAPKLTHDPPRLGQAFDYLMRFYLQRRNHLPTTEWIADSFQWLADESPVRRTDESSTPQAMEGAEYIPKALAALSRAHQEHEHYLLTGKISQALLESCLDLALLDKLYREGRIPDGIDTYAPEDIQELRNLITLIPAEHFTHPDLMLNPAMLTGQTGLIGDVDLLINRRLVDIKVYNSSILHREDFFQILTYALLAMSYGVHGDTLATPISSTVGIYYARHGWMCYLELEQLRKTKHQLKTISHLFTKLARTINADDNRPMPQKLSDDGRKQRNQLFRQRGLYWRRSESVGWQLFNSATQSYITEDEGMRLLEQAGLWHVKK